MDKLPLPGHSALEDYRVDTEHHYSPLFDDHPEKEGMLIAHPFVLQLRFEREKIPCVDIRF